MTYSPTVEWLRTQILDGLRNAIAGIDTGQASDAYIKATVVAHVLEGLSLKLDWTLNQVFPDSSTSENLDRHAAVYGVERKDPTAAEGMVTLTGTPGTVFGAGLAFTKGDGTAYATTEGGTLDGVTGEATVAAVATTLGAVGNVEAGEVFTLTAPPAGVDAEATAASDFTGGADEESDAQFLTRLLARIQSPPAGGTATDWRAWALEVDGVSEAYVYPLRRGLGTVDVVIFTVGPAGERATPGATLLTAVADYLETVRPVTVASYQVLAATEVPVDVTVSSLVAVEGYDEATVIAAVEQAIADAFPALAPGGTLYLTTHLHGVIADVEGVLDYSLDEPAANVGCTVDASTVEVLVAGTISVSA